jgi:hypothetical protein
VSVSNPCAYAVKAQNRIIMLVNIDNLLMETSFTLTVVFIFLTSPDYKAIFISSSDGLSS